jgi:hypothetical protein
VGEGVRPEDAEDRRRRWRIVMAAVAAVALGLTVPNLLDGSTTRRVPATGSGPDAPPDVNLYDGPTRGSMGGDQPFVQAVRALPWPDRDAAGGPAIQPADRHVPFAGDVPGGRWALVVAPPATPEEDAIPEDVAPDLIDAMWFTGPPGSTATELSPAIDPVTIKPSWPTELLDPATGVLVIVAAPGDELELSERPQVAADGSMTREFRGLGTTEGIAVTELPTTGLPYGTAARYRVARDTSDIPITPRTIARDAPGWTLPIDHPRGDPEEPGRTAAGYAAERVLAGIGLPVDEVEVTAQWVGDVPAHGPGQAAVVTVTLPNGAVAVDGQWMLPREVDGSLRGSDCGRTVLPAGVPASRRVYALVCDVVDDASGALLQTSLVVVAPPEVALVRTYDPSGGFLSEHPAEDGVVVARLPFGTQLVEAVTSGGVSLGRVWLVRDMVPFAE